MTGRPEGLGLYMDGLNTAASSERTFCKDRGTEGRDKNRGRKYAEEKRATEVFHMGEMI